VIYSLMRPQWPLTQRAAWLLEVCAGREWVRVHVRSGVMSATVQTAVLLMKMHSYIVVNRHLKLEVSGSGDCAPACKRNPLHP